MKIGPYAPKINRKTKYESINLLTLQKNNPSIIKKEFNDFINKDFRFEGINLVLSSNLLRGKETTNLLKKNYLNKNTEIIFTPLLKEILFEVNNFCSEEEYKEHKSNIIREKFIERFGKNKLFESNENIKKRFDSLIKIIENKKDKKILIISHTFFIKLFMIYLENPNLFINTKLLKKHINPNKRIMKFCEINKVKISKFKRYEVL